MIHFILELNDRSNDHFYYLYHEKNIKEMEPIFNVLIKKIFNLSILTGSDDLSDLRWW